MKFLILVLKGISPVAITKTLVFSDVHIPFHNEDYVKLLMFIIKSSRPTRIIINGDLGDLYNVSAYPKSLDVLTTYDDEVQAIKGFITALRIASPTSKIIYLLGNHEHRLSKFINDSLGVMRNRLSLEKELDLENLVDEWHPYKYKYRVEDTNLWVTHSPPSYSVTAARTSIMAKTGQSFIYACSHRPDFAYARRETNGTVEFDTVYINGFLGEKEKTKEHYAVFEYEKLNRSMPSVCMVTIVDGVDFSVELALIKNNIITVDGRTYQGTN